MKVKLLQLFLLIGVSINASLAQNEIKNAKLMNPEPFPYELYSTYIISNVDVFNGFDSIVSKKQNVYIKDGVIHSINQDSIQGNDILIIDGTGLTLMPGLIDAHVHVTGNGAVPWKKCKTNVKMNLETYLKAGITTVYDLGGLSSKLESLSTKVRKGKLNGPDIYHTHIPVTIKNSHPIPLTQLMLPWPLNKLINSIAPTIQKEMEAKKIVRSYVKKKVDYMKISCDQIPPGSPEMSQSLMNAMVKESHDAGLTVFTHIGSVDNALKAVNAGADILAHGIWRDRLSEQDADNIKESGIKVIYTIAGFYNVDKINLGEFNPSELDKKMVPSCVLHPVTEENGLDVHEQEVMNKFFQNVSDHRHNWEHNFDLLYKRGVSILVGTDSQLPGTYAGSTYHQEMSLLKQFGMSNYEILKAATYDNARLFLDNPDFGSIEVGKKANLLLVKGNPIDNLKVLQEPSLIIKSGKIH